MNSISNGFETVKQKATIAGYLEAQGAEKRGTNNYVCPFCGSGTGPNHSAAFYVYDNGEKWKCHSCGRGGDIFDLVGLYERTEDKREQLQAAADFVGVDVSGYDPRSTVSTVSEASPAEAHVMAPQPSKGTEGGREHEKRYIEATQRAIERHIKNPPSYGNNPLIYLESRGFDKEDVARFGLGYDPKNDAILIPFPNCEYWHARRMISPDADPKYLYPKKDDVGSRPIFGTPPDEGDYFVVEGFFDALSLWKTGFPAVALGGTHNDYALLEAVKAHGGRPCLMLDNDEPGKKAQAKLAELLQREGIEHTEACFENYPTSAKDANEVLEYRKEAGAVAFFRQVLADASSKADEAKEQRNEELLKSLHVVDSAYIVRRLCTGLDNREPIPTGLNDLDKALGGGLPAVGLVTLGAVSSTGKTTLAVQIADHIASTGRPVLFVTVEQSAEEILAKSLSRLMHSECHRDISAQDIRSNKWRAKWDRQTNDALMSACENYNARIAPSLHIMEATERPTVANVATAAEVVRESGGEAPVVFVDYLQLLESPSERLSDKQAADKNVTALRQLAREMKTCVFVISSLNRSSYSEGVTLDSFKESGAIEYGSDILLGLQPEGMTDKVEAVGESKRRVTARRAMRDYKTTFNRFCEIVVLKNRNGGIPSLPVTVLYRSIVNKFEDAHRLKEEEEQPLRV